MVSVTSLLYVKTTLTIRTLSHRSAYDGYLLLKIQATMLQRYRWGKKFGLKCSWVACLICHWQTVNFTSRKSLNTVVFFFLSKHKTTDVSLGILGKNIVRFHRQTHRGEKSGRAVTDSTVMMLLLSLSHVVAFGIYTLHWVCKSPTEWGQFTKYEMVIFAPVWCCYVSFFTGHL